MPRVRVRVTCLTFPKKNTKANNFFFFRDYRIQSIIYCYLLQLVLLITETLSDGSIDGIVNVHKSREERIFP